MWVREFVSNPKYLRRYEKARIIAKYIIHSKTPIPAPGLVESLTRTLSQNWETFWPSGLRRYVQVVFSSVRYIRSDRSDKIKLSSWHPTNPYATAVIEQEARVQIPQMSFFFAFFGQRLLSRLARRYYNMLSIFFAPRSIVRERWRERMTSSSRGSRKGRIY